MSRTKYRSSSSMLLASSSLKSDWSAFCGLAASSRADEAPIDGLSLVDAIVDDSELFKTQELEKSDGEEKSVGSGWKNFFWDTSSTPL